MSQETLNKPTDNKLKPPFQHLIIIKPLGFLYGSAGRFLSPENLVGRAGSNFPPSSATLSGIFAYQLNNNKNILDDLQLAGPFFANNDNPANFYVPTPLNCLVKDQKIKFMMSWVDGKWQTKINGKWDTPPNDKFANNTYLAINDWQKLLTDDAELPDVVTPPWRFVPHLHPKLKHDERRVIDEENEGSLFLENGVQLDPDYCLVYLSNTPIDNGWYRFGGEGHIVELECQQITEQDTIRQLLDQPIGKTFATITLGIWGSNRFSYRAPMKKPLEQNQNTDNYPSLKQELFWDTYKIEALLAGKATPFRYRLGNRKANNDNTDSEKTENSQVNDIEEDIDTTEGAKRLSRGRYGIPGGTVYILEQPLNKKWEDWDSAWFPTEGYSFKRWGCALALPLEII
jgi:CRISPR-associated protein Cmr3